MKTLKISAVATIACMLAWWLRIPQWVWPAHPYFTDFLMALVLSLVLQFVWSDPKQEAPHR